VSVPLIQTCLLQLGSDANLFPCFQAAPRRNDDFSLIFRYNSHQDRICKLPGLLKVNTVRIFHRSTLFLRFLLFSALFVACVATAQSPASDTATRPAILGNLEKGKYSNPIIGFELQLDPACTFVDEARAITWSTQFSQRLNLALRCGDNLFLLSSFPVHADEKINLKRDAQISLQGAMDGGGFKKQGALLIRTVSGTEVLVQGLSRHGSSGQELGFYHAFMIGRRYVSILTIGSETNKAVLSNFITKLIINPTQ
jgi:hypothetical protein